MYRLFRAPRGLRGKLFKLTGPIFLETLLMLTLGVVDTLMLSHHSDNAVAAVGVVNQLLNMVFLLFNITTTGTSVMCALYFGAKDNKSFIQVLGTSLLFNAGVGCLISLMLFLFGREMLVLMDIRPDLMPDAETYMHIVGGFGFFQAVSFTISAVLRAANKPNYAMQVTLLINVLNVFGNYALIFGHFGFPALGVQGAAISTSVCRGVAMTLLFIMLFKRLVPRIPLAYFRPFPFQKLKDVLKIGLPSAAEQISYDASQVTIVYFINMLGNEYLTARVYVMNIVIIGYIFSLSIAQATSICTGNLVGARKKQAAELNKAEKRKAEVDTLFARMYEDWAAGRITEYNFSMLSGKYQSEQAELDTKIEQLQSAIATESQNAADAEKWIALMKECVNPTELTAELLNTLIEKIVVHEAVKGEDGSREQEVEIFYRFIGKID